MWYNHMSTIFSWQGLIIILMSLAHLIAFFVYLGLANKSGRLVTSNQYLFMWINLVGFIFDIQALYVVSTYRASSRMLRWIFGWVIYSVIMLLFTVFMIGGYGYQNDVPASLWSVTWFLPLFFMLIYTFKARSGYCVSRMLGINEYRPRLADGRARALYYGFMGLVFPPLFWLIGFFFAFCLILQALWTGSDHRIYPVPGLLTSVQANGAGSWYDLHYWCVGPTTSDQTYLLLTDFCEPSTTMIGLAQSLASHGKRACVIDRPGYGWSRPGYWPQVSSDVVESIHQGLQNLNINGPYVLVGAGQGGLWWQLYLQSHSENIAGVVMIDTYPNNEMIETLAYNRTKTLVNLRNFNVQQQSSSDSNGGNSSSSSSSISGSDDIDSLLSSSSSSGQVPFDVKSEKSKSRSLAAWRASSPLAFTRTKDQSWPYFVPHGYVNMHKSLVGNNYHYQACYFEYGGTGTQLYQALYKYMSASVDSVLTYLHWPLRWPSFPETSPSGSLTGGGNGNGTTVIQPSDNDDSNGGVSKATKSTIPLILFISQASINSDCSSQHITNDQDCKNWQALAWFRFRQQQMYYQTLTNNVLLLMCTGTTSTDPIPCAPGFVWRRPDWLSIQLINGFGGNVSDGDSSETTSSSNGSDMSSPTSTTSTVTKTQTATSVESWLETVTTTITQVTEGETHTITETHLTTRTLGDIKTSTLNTWQ